MSIQTTLKTAFAGIAALSMVSVATQGLAANKPASQAGADQEKCYGVVKASKNACGTSQHSCAGQSNKDGDPNDWTYVPKGTCENLVGGSLTKPGDMPETGTSPTSEVSPATMTNSPGTADKKVVTS
jgi:uncharacterized membrane protein